MSTFSEVQRVIATDLRIDAASIHPRSSLVQDLGADSLALAELAVKLERLFKISIPDESLRDLARVEDVVHYIEARGRPAAGTAV